jgi:anaerobic selenocysteine-containing dehydrogenase
VGVSRRDFLRISGVGATGALLASIGVRTYPNVVNAQSPELRTRRSREFTTVCPYCAVGCGQIVSVENGKVTNIEGDPDHPINEGALCSKGAALYQVANNERRLNKVLYRPAGGTAWQEKSWDWAMDAISQRVKATRDATWVGKDSAGRTVNRTEGIACMGGAALDNEECYLYSRLARALGVAYLEHQARI